MRFRSRSLVAMLMCSSCSDVEPIPTCDRDALIQELSSYTADSIEDIALTGYGQFHLDQQLRAEWYRTVRDRIIWCRVASRRNNSPDPALTSIFISFEFLRQHFDLRLDIDFKVDVETYEEIASREVLEIQRALKEELR